MQTWDRQVISQLQKNTLVGAWRTLNTSLDIAFYDIGSLALEERASLSAHTTAEVSIIIVHPKARNKKIANFTPLEFISTQEQSPSDSIDAIVVTGAGSTLSLIL